MQMSDLPSPGHLSNSIQLRKEAYKAISYASTQADLTGKKSECATVLVAFFEACAAEARKSMADKPKKETK